LFIAEHCNALAVEAYNTAIHEIKENTLNTIKYTNVMESLNAVLRAQNRPAVPLDQDWINNAQELGKKTLDSLENELKVAKNNLVKEDIRVSSFFFFFFFFFFFYRYVFLFRSNRKKK
jgi:COP9 signalosome complex subunit 1